MSTEAASPEIPRRAARASRSWRRTVLGTVGALALLATGLGVAGAFRGPALAEASVAAASALDRPGQRLVLTADQSLSTVEAADVAIEPTVPVTVDASGPTITIRFDGMLRALTSYRVRVGVTGAATGVSGTLDYSFTTPDLPVTVLVRDPDGPDAVVRRDVSGTAPQTLFTADRIQELAVTPTGVAVVVLDGDTGDGRLVYQADGQQYPQDIALPGPGRVTRLQASDTTGRIGFVFSPDDTSDPDAPLAQLELLDPADPSGVPTVIAGLDGKPLPVLNWTFVPGTASLVAQDFDQQLLLVDTATGAAPSPLGEHAELRGFLPGTVTLVVADPTSGGLLDLATGDLTTLDLPPDGLDVTSYPGKLLLLAKDRYIEVVSHPIPGAGFRLRSEILLVDDSGPTTLYTPPDDAAIGNICLSPNAQYLAVEVLDPDGTGDGYANVPGRSGTTTYFVDLATGAANRGMTGFGASWCD